MRATRKSASTRWRPTSTGTIGTATATKTVGTLDGFVRTYNVADLAAPK